MNTPTIREFVKDNAERIVRESIEAITTVLTESSVPALGRAELAKLTGLGPASLRVALLRMQENNLITTSRRGPRSYNYSLTSRTTHVVDAPVNPLLTRPPLKGYDEMMRRFREGCMNMGGRA